MVPTAEVLEAEWIAVNANGDVVGRGNSMSSAAHAADENGSDDYVVKKIAPAGTYIL